MKRKALGRGFQGPRASNVVDAAIQYWTGAQLILTEHQEQAAVVSWALAQKGDLAEAGHIFAIPNGGHRHPAVAVKLKAEGVRPGVPDLFLPVPMKWPGGGARSHGLFVEMKRTKGSRTGKEQRLWHCRLRSLGYAVVVCKGSEAAVRAITDYLHCQLGPEVDVAYN